MRCRDDNVALPPDNDHVLNPAKHTEGPRDGHYATGLRAAATVSS